MAETLLAPAPVIAPLVSRHAGDAAFYWQQYDGSAHSCLAGLPQLLEFNRLLDAHLDGLRAAGDAGWEMALAQLARWKGAPEVFVCATLALEAPAPGRRLEQVWGAVSTNPQRMLRGLISALAWSPHSGGWMQHCVQQTRAPALAVAAWRSRALLPQSLEPVYRNALPQALTSDVPALRAAACRVQAMADTARLAPLLRDPAPAVRAEAAIGMLHYGLQGDQQNTAAAALWQSCHALMRELAQIGGLAKARAEHRLARWIRYLGLIAQLGHAGAAELLQRLPPRLGLWFMLHHGDARHLPWVVQHMDDPEVARLAGWIWSAMTGIDIKSAGLALPPRGPEQSPRPTDIHDPGLVEPNAARIRAMAGPTLAQEPCLRGQALDVEHLNTLVWQAPQALRWIAGTRLRMRGLPSVDTRAPAARQLASQPEEYAA